MRVLMVVVRGQTASYGGAAIQALSLCREFKKLSINSLILTSGDHHSPDLEIKRLCYKYPDILKKFFYPAALFFYLIFNWKKFDVLHIHGAYWMNFGAVMAAKLLGKPIIIKLSMFGEDDPLTIIKEKFRLHGFGILPYLSLKLATKIICISRELSKAYHKSQFSPKKLAEIPNGVDTNRFKPLAKKGRNSARENLGLAETGKIIVFNGSISLRKGIDILLKIWPALFEKYPEAKLLLIGPVDKTLVSQKKFVEYAKKMMTKEIFCKSVILTGLVPQEKLVNYLQVSDIFVLPSRREGLPNSLLEAMACGLPSVATNIGGISDIIVNNISGLLFQKNNKQQFLNHLLTLFEKDELARNMSKTARATTVEKYSISHIALQYKKLYKQLILN